MDGWIPNISAQVAKNQFFNIEKRRQWDEFLTDLKVLEIFPDQNAQGFLFIYFIFIYFPIHICFIFYLLLLLLFVCFGANCIICCVRTVSVCFVCFQFIDHFLHL